MTNATEHDAHCTCQDCMVDYIDAMPPTMPQAKLDALASAQYHLREELAILARTDVYGFDRQVAEREVAMYRDLIYRLLGLRED